VGRGQGLSLWSEEAYRGSRRVPQPPSGLFSLSLPRTRLKLPASVEMCFMLRQKTSWLDGFQSVSPDGEQLRLVPVEDQGSRSCLAQREAMISTIRPLGDVLARGRLRWCLESVGGCTSSSAGGSRSVSLVGRSSPRLVDSSKAPKFEPGQVDITKHRWTACAVIRALKRRWILRPPWLRSSRPG